MSNSNLIYSKAVIILSGGMDSTTLLYEMVHGTPDMFDNKPPYEEVVALSFDYGQRHSKELPFAGLTCQKLGVKHKTITLPLRFEGNALTGDIDVPEGHYADESMKDTVVPNRNGIMLSIAIGEAISRGFGTVGYAAHAGDHAIYPDCRPVFVEAITKMAELCFYEPVKLYAPFIHITKTDIVKVGKTIGVDYSLTWSCYKGGENHCGKCGTCVERIEAFRDSNNIDPMMVEQTTKEEENAESQDSSG